MGFSDFKELTFEDKDFFDRLLEREQPEISEYTFSNLFVWSESRKVFFAQQGEGVFLLAQKGGDSFFYPIIGFSDLVRGYRELAEVARSLKINFRLERIPRAHAEVLRELRYPVIDDRDNYDYVYHTADLAYLKGRHYDGKRGFIRKFYSKYEFDCREYGKDIQDKCLELVDRWIASKEKDTVPLEEERRAIVRLMDYYERMDCKGCVALVKDKVAAFSFGEKLNDSTFVVHFEKADVGYEGSYQAINQRFVENRVLDRFDYINREQDLGILGIRKAKMSYLPVKLVEKYRIEPAGGPEKEKK